MPHHPDSTYRPYVDGLRALAVLSVVASHASDSLFTGGYVGVDIFFVLSGYLITTILLRDQAAGRASLTTFYARRIRRIFPALLLVLAATWIMGQALLFTFELPALGRHIAAGMAFLANVALWSEAGYFDADAAMKPLLHLWSLGIEEQFYLAWPPLIWLAARYGRAGTFTALILLISLLLNLVLIRSDPVSTFYLPHTRIWELLIGALLAIREHDQSTRELDPQRVPTGWRRWSCDLMAAAGVVLLAVAILGFDRTSPYPGWRALLPTLGTALILLAGSSSLINQRLFGHPVAVFIGLISYPLYLWHWPLLFTARIATPGSPGIGLRLAAIAVAVVLAWVTYRFLEQPIRRAATARSVAALLTLAAGMTAIGVATWQGIGPPSRLEAASQYIAALAPIPESRNAKCPSLVSFPTHICLIEPDGGVPTLALIDDSHSGHLIGGLSAYLATTGRAVVNFASNGCMPLWTEAATDPELRRCSGLMQPALEFARTENKIETVMLAAAWGNRLRSVGEATFEAALRRTLLRLVATSKRVVFVHDTPDLTFHPRACFNALRFSPDLRDVPCRIDRHRAEVAQTNYRRVVLRVLADLPEVEIFDPFPTFCDEAYCYGARDGQILYSDKDHLSETGSRLLGPLFRERLALK